MNLEEGTIIVFILKNREPVCFIWALLPTSKMAAAASAVTFPYHAIQRKRSLLWNSHSHCPDCVTCSSHEVRETRNMPVRLSQLELSDYIHGGISRFNGP